MKSYLKTAFILFLLTLGSVTHAQQVQLITGDEERTSFENKSYLVVKSLTLKGLPGSPGFLVRGVDGPWYAKAHPNAVPPTAPSSDQNFVRSEAVLTSGITTEPQIKSLTLADKAVSFNYSDGMGRALQSVAVGATPSLNDALQPSYYDAFGRPARQYLPYAAGGSAGAYRPSALTDQSAFYNNTNDKVADDNRAYSESVYDNLSGNVVAQSTAVGAAWASKPSTAYLKIYDASMPVPSWDIVNGLPVSTTIYPGGSLTVSESQNEESMVSRTYSDFMGRTILKGPQ